MTRRLLLLSCAQKKRSDAVQLRAIDRYDGPAYKVLRRYVDAHAHEAPDIYILSAQFGLIHGDALIPAYDRRMTLQRAAELHEQIAAELDSLDVSRRYKHVFVYAGSVYRQALTSVRIPADCLTLATGNPGVQLSQLKTWLYRDSRPSTASGSIAHDGAAAVRFRLRGRDYEVTPDQVVAVARTALQNGVPEALKAAAWYVPVDGHKIAPKWLVSQLTSLPVGTFHSEESRRVLGLLGVRVCSAFADSGGVSDD